MRFRFKKLLQIYTKINIVGGLVLGFQQIRQSFVQTLAIIISNELKEKWSPERYFSAIPTFEAMLYKILPNNSSAEEPQDEIKNNFFD